MKKRTLLISMMIFVALTTAWGQTQIYVSTEGNDNNSGSINSPLKTLKGARDKLRAVGANGSTVYFRGGRYPVTETVTLGSQDNGATYTAYNNETVIFDGSVYVDPNKFQLVTDQSQLSRMHANANGKVYSQVITDNNLKNLLIKPTPILTMNDKLMIIARFPNIGFAHINQSTISGGYEKVNTIGTNTAPKGGRFALHESFNKSKWEAEIKRNYKAVARGYLSANWLKETITIVSGTGGYLRLKDGSKYGLDRMVDRGWPNRMFVMQLLCELDEPGEWYFDDKDSRLYIYPYENITGTSVIGVAAGPQMVEINGASNITIEKMKVQCIGNGSNGHGAINVKSGSNIKIAGITFRYIAEPVSAANFWDNVKNSTMQSCNFYDVWNSTRLYGGSYGTSSITKGNNRIQNCHFTQVYAKDLYGKACGMHGAGNIFKNNLIHNMNGQPVTHSGVDHIIELNELFNVGIEEGDGGAIYTGAKLFSYGNMLRHNFIHHIISVPGINGRNGFYSDDHDGGDKYIENVLYKAGYHSIYCNKGAGHTIQDNVILKGYHGVYVGHHEPSLIDHLNTAKEYLKTDPNSNDKANYIGKAEKVIGDFANNNTGTYNTSWDNSFWATRYPSLKWALRKNNYLGMYPIEVRVYENMFLDLYKKVLIGSWSAERDSRTLPGWNVFVNQSNLNFKWNSSKPSYAPNIPFDNIGLYKDAYRCAVPNKDTYRSKVRQRFNNSVGYKVATYDRNTVNAEIYYNSGKMVTDLVPCENEINFPDGGTGGKEGWFDLGTPTSPVFTDYIRVSEQTTSGSYRWTNGSSLQSRDRGTGANNINRDFVFSDQPRTFEYTTSNGTYDVVVTLGDLNGPHDDMIIKAEGKTVKSNIDRAKAQIANETFQVTVNDGKLSLEFSDGGGSNPHWVVNRIKIDKASSSSTGKPIVSFANPTSGQSFNAPASVYVKVNANDPDGSISNVKLYLNNTLVRQENVNPYEWNASNQNDPALKNMAAGTYSLRAVATDNSGKTGEKTISITVGSGGGSTIPGTPITTEAESFINTSGTYNDASAGGPGFGVKNNGSSINFVNNGDWAEYNINIPEDGEYKIVYYISSPVTGSTISFSADGSVLNTTTVPNNGSWDNYQALNASGNVNLTKGNHVIRLTAGAQTWTWNLDKFTLQRVGAMKSAKEMITEKTSGLIIYPNPATDELNINLPGINGMVELYVFNSVGTVLINEQFSESYHKVSLSGLASGMYLLQVVNGGNTISKLFIKE